MRTSIVAFIVAGICTAAVADNGSKREEDMLGQMRAEQRALAKQAAGGVTAADVGDPDSFGRNVQFLGVAQTGLVQVVVPGACSPPDPNFPDDRCVEADPSAVTVVQARDIGRMRLPARAAHSLLCHSITALRSYSFRNFTANPVNASFNFAASITIENEVLNDPTLIDPNTGLPFNGSLEVAFGFGSDTQTLHPTDQVRRSHNNTRACIGGLISKQTLTQSFGLTDAQADDFFRKPMMLRLNITLRSQFADLAAAFFGLRVFGD